MSIIISNPEPDREAPTVSRSETMTAWRSAVHERDMALPVIAFIVNGDETSAMAQRAHAFARHMPQHDIRIAYRSANKVVSLFAFLWFLLLTRPAVTYVFDISYSGVLAAGLYRQAFGNRLIIDTGDAITELARSLGRGRVGVLFTSLLERFAVRVADRMIVRGSFHRELLAGANINAEVVQDGVDVSSFAAEDVRNLRKQNGLEGVLTIGLVGSSVWSEKLQMCYGWELVETIRLLKEKPLKGIMIGSGSGTTHLKARCREYGIEDRMFFLDHVPYEQLARYLSLIDVCLSTQTNDIVGNVRTTGKLPLYLAAGRFILASNVGEAARVLPKEMLVDYEGVKDENYPAKLAGRIESILDEPKSANKADVINIARRHFDYSLLARRAASVIQHTLHMDEQKTDVLRDGRNKVDDAIARMLHEFRDNDWMLNEHWPLNEPHVRLMVADVLARFPQTSGTRILDVGCFNGYISFLFRQLGYEVTGTDICEHESREQLFARANIKYVSANMNEASPFSQLGQEEFHVVIIAQVIEHILNHPLGLIRDLAEKMQPGGIMILTTPNPANFMNAARTLRGRSLLWGTDDFVDLPKTDKGRIISEGHIHYREYTRDELSRMLTKAGLRVTRSQYLGLGVTPSQSSLKRMLKRNLLTRKLMARRLFASNHYVLARKEAKDDGRRY